MQGQAPRYPPRHARVIRATCLRRTRIAGTYDAMQSVPAKRLATRLRQYMKDTGTTQNQAAAALHMSQSAFSRRYLGHVELRASEVAILATLLNVAVSDLYGDSAVSV